LSLPRVASFTIRSFGALKSFSFKHLHKRDNDTRTSQEKDKLSARRRLREPDMSNTFIGLTMLVTLNSPPGAQLRGVVSGIEPGKSLTLKNGNSIYPKPYPDLP